MQLENLAYETRNVQAQRQQVYFVVEDLEILSASALYTGEPFGNRGGFGSMPSIGPGIARIMPEAGNLIERIRKDTDLPSHLNYEYLVPGIKKPLVNIHIPLDDN